MVCLSVIVLCYRITCLWFSNKRFCNKKEVLFVPGLYRVKECQSKMELKDIRWRLSYMCRQKNRKYKLRDGFLLNTWFTEDWELSPDHWTSTKNLSPVNALSGLRLNIPLLGALAHTCSPLACNLGQHAFLEAQFLCYCQINSTSGHFSLPWFTSVFRLAKVTSSAYPLSICFVSYW